LALAVPLSRFTPQVGGGSAFFVRRITIFPKFSDITIITINQRTITMSADKTEYKKIQGQILKHLFDKAKAEKFTEITALTKNPESEAQYHCDVLTEQGFIAAQRVSIGGGHTVAGYVITALGRKEVMEQ
jgi:hypothetical protein